MREGLQPRVVLLLFLPCLLLVHSSSFFFSSPPFPSCALFVNLVSRPLCVNAFVRVVGGLGASGAAPWGWGRCRCRCRCSADPSAGPVHSQPHAHSNTVQRARANTNNRTPHHTTPLAPHRDDDPARRRSVCLRGTGAGRLRCRAAVRARVRYRPHRDGRAAARMVLGFGRRKCGLVSERCTGRGGEAPL